MTLRFVLAAVAISVAAPVCQARAGDPSPAPSQVPKAIAGAWKLDPARSEDARKKMHDQMTHRGEGGGSGGFPGPAGGPSGFPGGPEGPGGPGGGPGGRGRMDPQAMREAVDDLLEAPEAMAITVGADEVEIAERDGRLRHLRPNGKKMKRGGAVTESRARWDGETLVNEIWLGDGAMHITEMLARDGATGELRFTVRVENSRFGGDPLTVTRVYVPEGPTSPATPPSKTPGTAEGLKIRMGSISAS